MKKLVLFAFGLSLVYAGCKVSSEKLPDPVANQEGLSNDEIELLDANSQKWVAGIQGGGSGTEYFFKVVIMTDDQLEFKDLWLKNGLHQDIYLSRNQSSVSAAPVSIHKGDTITLRASILNDASQVLESAPIDFNGTALIGYFLNDSQQFQVVKTIGQLPIQNRP